MKALEAALLAAQDAGDRHALVTLYQQAAEAVSGAERAFFLPQAHVFAMEVAHPQAAALRAQLVEMGREEPL